ncbi:C-type lectin domain family 12 member A-like [Pogoniulus pusillus]|uniref:C-type lectin domain family 12 member A-like n=1 Tax=Pogoniulus pusillus TaxID=488313 RepID=UPI0030B9896E
MTEEVTYANLKFENTYELENIREPKDTKEKGPPASSHSYGPVVLILFMLCLVLLTVLVALAVLLFQIPEEYRTQLRSLNATNHELHANFSRALHQMGTQLCLGREAGLQSNGLSCALCPANWRWEGGNTCYYHSSDKKTWGQGHQFCSLRNSTLLLIKEASKLELVNRFPRRTYWTGLMFRDDVRDWYWADNTAVTEDQRFWVKLEKAPEKCPSFYYGRIYEEFCEYESYYVCEKPAIQLQRHDNHWQN